MYLIATTLLIATDRKAAADSIPTLVDQYNTFLLLVYTCDRIRQLRHCTTTNTNTTTTDDDDS